MSVKDACSEGEKGGEETNESEDVNTNTGNKRHKYGEREL
jgi:hypothetical protein